MLHAGRLEPLQGRTRRHGGRSGAGKRRRGCNGGSGGGCDRGDAGRSGGRGGAVHGGYAKRLAKRFAPLRVKMPP
ncbi:MAG: hypothetical protein B7Y96_03165 [Comamonadaceae bacterium 32-67-11]|nr:MAG: hypothetical protein B7Y96_03165 [Comamonadaceae bacterium 32-67-11]